MKTLYNFFFVLSILFCSCSATNHLAKSENDDLYYRPSHESGAKIDSIKNNIRSTDQYIYTSTKGKYYQGDVKLSLAALAETVKPVPEAYREIQRGRSINSSGWFVLVVIAPASFGLGIAGNLFDVKHEPNNIYVLEGLADLVALAGFVIIKNGVTKIVKGVQIYNSSVKTGGQTNTGSIIFGLTKDGVGLTWRF